jgi:hypothetical protein
MQVFARICAVAIGLPIRRKKPPLKGWSRESGEQLLRIPQKKHARNSFVSQRGASGALVDLDNKWAHPAFGLG